MHRMTQPGPLSLYPRPETHTRDPCGDDLEGVEESSQAYLWWSVLVADDYGCLTLYAVQFLQLQAVTDDTDVACVRVKKVHRPVFRFLTVVAKRSGDFELERPLSRNKHVRRPLGPDGS